uniref:Uncharacterized protein n=1 Tax=Anguilla anguilla TaxID=7936 RepID=A0A0E9W7L4_ANGAN
MYSMRAVCLLGHKPTMSVGPVTFITLHQSHVHMCLHPPGWPWRWGSHKRFSAACNEGTSDSF